MKLFLFGISLLIGGLRPQERVYHIGVFVSPECPISQKYVSTLNQIYATYKDQPGLKWSFVVPAAISRKDLAEFVRAYDVEFPLLADSRQLRKTRLYKATVTPEVVILHGRDVVYRGAIDNWFYALGRYRSHITERYLIAALDAILHDRTPAVRETTPVGCLIGQAELKIP